jgi:hypothetical protein
MLVTRDKLPSSPIRTRPSRRDSRSQSGRSTRAPRLALWPRKASI